MTAIIPAKIGEMNQDDTLDNAINQKYSFE